VAGKYFVGPSFVKQFVPKSYLHKPAHLRRGDACINTLAVLVCF
jgi:hypothetical protein